MLFHVNNVEGGTSSMRNKLYVGLLAGASAGYLLRRLGKRWGATEDEVHRSLPGDDLVAHPMVETTHAITIHAPAAAIWPWLVQMGYDRGWWYTDAHWYRLVETSLWKAKPHTSANHIIPELQHLAVGNTVPDGPPGTAFFTVAQLQPQQAIALYSTTHILFMAPASVRNNPRLGLYGDFSWVFVLDEKEEGVTRLIVRTRASYGPRLFRMLTLPLLYPGDFVMARMMLRGIKQRVEQNVGTGSGKAERGEPLALTTREDGRVGVGSHIS
jgi:hypothetical protein